MFILKLFKAIIIFATFLIAYLPISLNPKFFEKNWPSDVSYIIEDDIVRNVDYQPMEV